jgi:hypothetical protein
LKLEVVRVDFGILKDARENMTVVFDGFPICGKPLIIVNTYSPDEEVERVHKSSPRAMFEIPWHLVLEVARTSLGKATFSFPP